ncbi:MAG: zinc-ribbon domain-containing protein [Vulcanimicrobiota bacterium]
MRRACGQRPPSYYSLEAEKPRIAAEWHPTRNKPLTPSDVSSDSDMEVWWMCRRGHEWRSKVVTRSIIKGCPLCTQKDRVSKPYKELKNSLYLKNPILAREWHPRKNRPLSPRNVTTHSHKKVWWKCSRGHKWMTMIKTRSEGSGCPVCARIDAISRKPVRYEKSIADLNPSLAREWHPGKNGMLTPEHLTPGSDRKVWWQCSKGHEWQAKVYHRNKGCGCPVCASSKAKPDYNLASIHPSLAEEWHPVKNGALTPYDVPPGSRRKVWWICSNGHEWQAHICERHKGNGCPGCSHRIATSEYCLATINPKLAAEWHPRKNGTLTPRDVTPGADRRVWWICGKGHEWQARVYKRNNGNGCPICWIESHRKRII